MFRQKKNHINTQFCVNKKQKNGLDYKFRTLCDFDEPVIIKNPNEANTLLQKINVGYVSTYPLLIEDYNRYQNISPIVVIQYNINLGLNVKLKNGAILDYHKREFTFDIENCIGSPKLNYCDDYNLIKEIENNNKNLDGFELYYYFDVLSSIETLYKKIEHLIY